MAAADPRDSSSRLAPYACRPTRGRLIDEPESLIRSPFQRDRDRVVHARAFRRLMYKTQVFVSHEGDHYRTRLTHSLEVAQISRTIARVLGLDEDLAEVVALAHDLGHPPFGHAGEEALAQAAADFGGFDHNVQALRVITMFERRYAAFDGLNLSWETIEGIAKHNGPMTGPLADPRPKPPVVTETLAAISSIKPLDLDGWPSIEAQVAALADDVAYITHDIDDGLRAGLLSIADVAEQPLAGPLLKQLVAAYPGLEQRRLIGELLRRLIDRMVTDLITETRRRIAAAGIAHADDARALGAPTVAFSAEMDQDRHAIKAYLFGALYRHVRVNRMTSKARRVVRDLVALFLAEPECLPDGWRERAEGPGNAATACVVVDYVAGMTDRHARDEYEKLFNPFVRT